MSNTFLLEIFKNELCIPVLTKLNFQKPLLSSQYIHIFCSSYTKHIDNYKYDLQEDDLENRPLMP